MGLGSIGISELVVIFMIVLVFFGPKRFPEIARSMGSAMREFRRSLNQIQRELEELDPTRDLPGRDLLKDIRAGKPGNWLDPNKSTDQETKRAPGDRSAPEPSGSQVTGESAAAQQFPMFDERAPAEPEDTPPPPEDSPMPEPDKDRDSVAGPTVDSRSD